MLAKAVDLRNCCSLALRLREQARSHIEFHRAIDRAICRGSARGRAD